MLALRPEKYPHLKSVLPLSKLSMDILEPIHLATIEVVVEFFYFFICSSLFLSNMQYVH